MNSVDTHASAAMRPQQAHASAADRGAAAATSRVAGGSTEEESDEMLATRFGAVPIAPDRQVRFRGGLPGFPDVERFQLDPIPGLQSDLMLLQAVDAPDISFITLPLPDDIPVLRQDDLANVSRMLDIAPGELMILAIVTLAAHHDRIEKYLNLRAPLFIDARRKIGAQVVLADASYPLRYRLDAAVG